jgi:hypothetical protein
MKPGCSLQSIFCRKFYVETEEDAIAARQMQRVKEMEEQSGSSADKYERMKWVPPPD